MIRTIFLTIFEGIEAKNLLRTPVLDTLLSEKNLRVVLLTKSKDRVEYYQKKFSRSELVYEVVDIPPPSGLDAFFAKLKFLLLRTGSTDLKRAMVYEIKPNAIFYHLGALIKWIFARPLIRRAVRLIDYLVVRNRSYASIFDKYKPDLVFMAHLFNEPEIHLLREAKRRNIPTVGFVNSWDKLTSRATLRLKPDRLIVFNGIVKKEAVKYAEMRDEDVYISGIPQYDMYYVAGISSREDFFRRKGIDPSKKLIVYASMGKAFSDSDWDMIDFLHECEINKSFGNSALLVRFQPNDFLDEEEIKKRPWLVYDYPGIRFGSKRGVDWDMDENDLKNLKDTMMHMDVIITYASSVSIDAAVVDKPVININFEINNGHPLIKSPTQYYKADHYKNALSTGGIRLVNNKEELIAWVNRYLKDPSQDSDGRRVLVREQCAFTDGKSGERIGRFVLDFLHERRV